MWDNVNILREIVPKPGNKDFYIIRLDQSKAFDYISRDYLWSVMEAFGSPDSFIDVVKCLYAKSNVCVNVNSVLTESSEVERGVKQGCPLSAALYVLAMSPLIKSINSDSLLSGIRVGRTNSQSHRLH